MLNIALPKGRLGEKVYQMFAKAGFECPSILENNRKLIFENKEERIKLNNISHPLIIKEMRRRIDEFDGLVFVEIPLLFETKLEYLCDKIICVFVDEKTQINRLMARDGIEYEYTLNKIKSQIPLENKVKKSDFVIDSSLGFEDTKRQINEIINILKEAI